MHNTDWDRVRAAARTILDEIDPDPGREGLAETPDRVAEALRFWCSGYDQDPGDVLKQFEDGAERYDELILASNIDVFSICEHHMASFSGIAHVGYIPGNGRVVGLSKLARVVEIYARRLQVQERLTRQIADALWTHLGPLAVGVVLKCRHHCCESRGVQKVGMVVTTSAMLGAFRDRPEARAEFFSLVASAEARS